jgi:hypothetical protein
MEDIMDKHCLGKLEVAGVFSNEGKDRKRAQSFIVQFD